MRMRPAEVGILLATAALVSTAPLAYGASRTAPRHAPSQGQVTLLETGSTLLYPLFNEWAPAFTKTHPSIRITTAGTGSGTGISQAEEGKVQIGASDAYLPPIHPADMMNIPLAISAQQVNYNLPGRNAVHLRLSGPVLAGIYTGRITMWNAPQIRALNPGVKLPAHAIIPVRREDSSGDTFLFTQYMTFSAGNKAWPAGYGTAISWPPLPSEISAEGNSGMVTAVKSNPYSIAYIGVSYEHETEADHLGQAMLENRAGKFVLPTPASIEAAAEALVGKTPKSEALSLIYAPGADAYPIINYEYAVVSKALAPANKAAATRTFLDWALTAGQSMAYLGAVNFRPLPPAVVRMSEAQVAAIR